MKKHLPTFFVLCVFFCGLALFLYPTISNLWNEHINSSLISDYVTEEETRSEEHYTQILQNARLYNQNLHDEAKLAELGLSYASTLNPTGNGIMGYLEIPKISVQLVIYHSLDDGLLQSGIGHMEGTALPVGGESTHAVLAGHSGLPSAKLLTHLDQMAMGDRFYIHAAGEVLTYRVDDIAVVLPHQVEKLAVESGRDLVTLVTCTPYGINSHRLLVRGTRVQPEEIVTGHTLFLADEVRWIDPLYLVPVCLIVLVAGAVVCTMLRRILERKHGELAHEKENDTME